MPNILVFKDDTIGKIMIAISLFVIFMIEFTAIIFFIIFFINPEYEKKFLYFSLIAGSISSAIISPYLYKEAIKRKWHLFWHATYD